MMSAKVLWNLCAINAVNAALCHATDVELSFASRLPGAVAKVKGVTLVRR